MPASFTSRATLAVLALLGAAAAQQAPRFEVASIRPSPPHAATMAGMNTGMGCARVTGRITCDDMPLAYYVRLAYGVKSFQVIAPGWMSKDRFDLEATFPPKTTSIQLRLMEQSLLAERFGLVVHHAAKPGLARVLTLVPGGAKLRPTKPGAAAIQLPARGHFSIGPNGCPEIPQAAWPRRSWITVELSIGQLCILGAAQSLDALSTELERFLNAQVTNATGLIGRYDIELGFLPPGTPFPQGNRVPAPSLTEALREQLGLRLTRSRGRVDVIVVDRCNRTPVAN